MDNFEKFLPGQELTPAVIAAALSACATETVVLNSERIEQRFGSYGIDVLASEAGLRRSSLYSIQSRERICRTYAVVRFTDEPDSSYRPEHAKVLAGNSLGQVFKANGWQLHKQTLHIGSFAIATPDTEITRLMRLPGRRQLALHVYQLLLARGEQIFEYATTIEVHHPEYLSRSELLDIYRYGDAESLAEDAVERLLRIVVSQGNQ